MRDGVRRALRGLRAALTLVAGLALATAAQAITFDYTANYISGHASGALVVEGTFNVSIDFGEDEFETLTIIDPDGWMSPYDITTWVRYLGPGASQQYWFKPNSIYPPAPVFPGWTQEDAFKLVGYSYRQGLITPDGAHVDQLLTFRADVDWSGAPGGTRYGTGTWTLRSSLTQCRTPPRLADLPA